MFAEKTFSCLQSLTFTKKNELERRAKFIEKLSRVVCNLSPATPNELLLKRHQAQTSLCVISRAITFFPNHMLGLALLEVHFDAMAFSIP